MESLLFSTFVVTLAEIGDKTQLLAMVLATRFRKPLPIIAGILVATLANHALAATAGFFVTDLLASDWFRYAVALSFIAMAAWTLVPDKLDDGAKIRDGAGVFLATLAAFFVVEIGDKTQVATAALAARFHNIELVTIGTTLGMMIANVPAVFLGDALTKRVSLHYVRIGAALIFLGLGLFGLAETSGAADALDDWQMPADGPVSLAIAAVLALTALSYPLRAPFAWNGPASWLRLAAVFGAAKFLMLAAGWAVGSTLTRIFEPIDHWIAFTLLAVLGLFTIAQPVLRREAAEEPSNDTIEIIVYQAALISLDALIVGLILGLLNSGVGLAAMATGVFAFIGAALGAACARHAPVTMRRQPEFWGGALFVAIGGVILFQHLAAA